MKHLDIDEIIVAVREQRGGVLPLRALLECRLDRRSGYRPAAILRARTRACPDRVAQGELADLWEGFPSNLAAWRREARFRHRRRGGAAADRAAAHGSSSHVLISLDGGAPIIYRQERVGCRGQRFTLLKFRSMTKDAEKDGQAAWASINDSRVTRYRALHAPHSRSTSCRN